MTEVEVREERKRLLQRLDVAHTEIEVTQALIRGLQRTCDHPNALKTSHMGETCHHCYACGACDV